jgi:hypothetical protein
MTNHPTTDSFASLGSGTKTSEDKRPIHTANEPVRKDITSKVAPSANSSPVSINPIPQTPNTPKQTTATFVATTSSRPAPLSSEEASKLEALLKAVRQGGQEQNEILIALQSAFGSARTLEILPYLSSLFSYTRGDASKSMSSATVMKGATGPPPLLPASAAKSPLPTLSFSPSVPQSGLPPTKKQRVSDREMGEWSVLNEEGATVSSDVSVSAKSLLDVTHLAGVDLAEEANLILAPLTPANSNANTSTLSTAAATGPSVGMPTAGDGEFGVLHKLPIQRKMEQLCAKYKLSLGPHTAELMAHALAERLRSLLVQAIVVAKQRLDVYRMNSGYDYITSAVPRRYLVLMEKRDKESRERQRLGAAASPTPTTSGTAPTPVAHPTTTNTSLSTLSSPSGATLTPAPQALSNATSQSALATAAAIAITDTVSVAPGVVPPLSSRELTLLLSLHNKQKNGPPGVPHGGLEPHELLLYQRLAHQHQTSLHRIAKRDILFLCERDPHLRRSQFLLSASMGLNKQSSK